MNKNQVGLLIKSQGGGTWPDAVFNVHQKIRHVLEKAIAHFQLDGHQNYEVLLSRATEQRTLPLDQSIQAAGVRTGDTLLIRTIGRTIDGTSTRA